MMDHDFDQLVNETFELSKGNFRNPFDQYQTDFQNEYPCSPGLFYFINKKERIFSLKTMPSDDLNKTYQNMQAGEGEFQEWKDNLKELSFFQTNYFELAEVLADHMKNRRYPLYEETLYNISDPGSGWWISQGQNTFQLFFKYPKATNSSQAIKIGQLGDNKISMTRFSQCRPFLEHFFNLDEFHCDDRSLKIITSNQSDINFELFWKIFTQGRDPEALFINTSPNEFQTLKLFFSELAAVRRFWIQIEKQLKSNPSQ